MKKKYILLAITMLFISCKGSQQMEVAGKQWRIMDSIVKSIEVPFFNDKTYSVLDFGALADQKVDNTIAINKAILTCCNEGGGTVLIPMVKYLTGPINLQNNVNLHLEEGAETLFSTNPTDYAIVHTSYEGTELMNYSHLIYVYKKTNIAIIGKGVLNGQASNENWWWWCGSSKYGWSEGKLKQSDPLNLFRLMDMAEEGVSVSERVFGQGHYLRPTFVDFFECTNVLLKEVKIINAPFWVIHPMKSKNVVVDGVTVESHGPNNDGCDPEYSKNVIIRNFIFNTGDDCIAIKSGRNADARRVAIPSENIIVQNCKMIDGHGGAVIGSEI